MKFSIGDRVIISGIVSGYASDCFLGKIGTVKRIIKNSNPRCGTMYLVDFINIYTELNDEARSYLHNGFSPIYSDGDKVIGETLTYPTGAFYYEEDLKSLSCNNERFKLKEMY